jgi:hypothetical protein
MGCDPMRRGSALSRATPSRRAAREPKPAPSSATTSRASPSWWSDRGPGTYGPTYTSSTSFPHGPRGQNSWSADPARSPPSLSALAPFGASRPCGRPSSRNSSTRTTRTRSRSADRLRRSNPREGLSRRGNSGEAPPASWKPPWSAFDLTLLSSAAPALHDDQAPSVQGLRHGAGLAETAPEQASARLLVHPTNSLTPSALSP